jgi:hypothetical protein
MCLRLSPLFDAALLGEILPGIVGDFPSRLRTVFWNDDLQSDISAEMFAAIGSKRIDTSSIRCGSRDHDS